MTTVETDAPPSGLRTRLVGSTKEAWGDFSRGVRTFPGSVRTAVRDPRSMVDGAAVTVSSVTYQAGGKLLLTLSGPATGATSLTYQGHNGAGPWITNATGTGLLAFTMAIT